MLVFWFMSALWYVKLFKLAVSFEFILSKLKFHAYRIQTNIETFY